MNEIVKIEDIHDLIFELRDERVILDKDVAQIYGVETKRINEAVRNNPDKFPIGYILQLTKEEWDGLKSKISTSNKREKVDTTKVVENFDHLEKLKYSPYLPKAFTEKGLYMLATILKSNSATQTTIAIIETFSKLREISRNVKEITVIEDKSVQKSLMQKKWRVVYRNF